MLHILVIGFGWLMAAFLFVALCSTSRFSNSYSHTVFSGYDKKVGTKS